MKTIIVKDADGRTTTESVPENQDEINKQAQKDKIANLREHLYLAFLMLGVISFSVGIYISLKRLKSES
jgi:hypothetical protein